VSAFYASPDAPRTLVRFAFCKDAAKIEAAGQRLAAYFGAGGAGRV